MTNKRAIEILEFINRESTDYLDYMDIRKATRMAINALERQIPRKPDRTQKDKDGMPLEKCPVCFSFGIDEYCIHCGQAIDWSENDD